MNISNLFKTKKLVYSLEVFPPKTTSSIDTIFNTLYQLRKLPADFISVTYGAGGNEAQKHKTCEIASLIKSEYNIEPLAHLTCVNSDRDVIVEQLEKLKKNNITNILALRGDKTPNMVISRDFSHASDLASFIRSYDSSFNICGACYPEGHCESENIESDIENLHYKVENGMTHLITQLFFDNNSFYTFRDKVAATGINIPIQAGIMPITSKSQIERTVSMCGASLPNRFATMINRYSDDPEALRDAGISYATNQIIDLIANGVDGIHLYTMNNVYVASKISENIESIIKSANK